jgi:hypothetical protein
LKHPAALFAFRSVFHKTVPPSKRFGCVMRSHRGRVVRNRCIDGKEDRNGVIRWTVQLADPQNTPRSEQRENEGEHGAGYAGCADPPHPAPNPAPQPPTAPTGYDLLRGLRSTSPCAHVREANTDPASRTDPLVQGEGTSKFTPHPAPPPTTLTGQGVNVPGFDFPLRGVEGDIPRIPDDPEDPDGTFEVTVSV